MKRLLLSFLIVTIITSVFCTYSAMAASADEYAGLVRYIPTKITADADEVIVEGYFVNLNKGVTVRQIEDFNMDIYEYGHLLISGYFGKLNSFSIKPLGTAYQVFTFNQDHSLGNGTDACHDAIYADIACGVLFEY